MKVSNRARTPAICSISRSSELVVHEVGGVYAMAYAAFMASWVAEMDTRPRDPEAATVALMELVLALFAFILGASLCCVPGC